MARATRAKSRSNAVRIELPEIGPSEPESAPSADEEAIEEALGQLPEGTVAKLYYIGEDGRKAFVMQTAPSAMTEERIAKCGPGTYRVVMYGPLNDGTSRKGFRGQREVLVRPPTDDLPPASNGATATAPQPSGLDAAMAMMVMQMVKQMGDMSQMQMLAMRDNSTVLQAQLTQMGAQTQALVASLKDGSRERDPLGDMEKMATILKPVVQSGSPLSALKEFAELRELLGDGRTEDPDARMWGTIEKVAPAIFAGAKQQDTAARAIPPTTTDATPVAPNTTSAPPEPLTTVPASVQALSPFLPQLLEDAQTGAPAEVVAELLTYRIPAGYHQLAIGALDAPTVTAEIVAAVPAFAPFQPWLESVRTHLVRYLRGEDDPEEAEGT